MNSREKSVVSLWNKHSVPQIAAKLGTTNKLIYTMAARLGLKSHKELAEEAEEPKPEVIARRAAEVRRKWSPEERERRAIGRPVAYEIPRFTSRQMFPEFQGAGK